jgi:ATP-dependent DNA helicase RecG
VTRFASDKSGDAYLDDRQLQGPLVRVFEQAFEVLSQHVRWEARFQTGDVRRTDRPEYPFEALREGLVNAFAHRDYAGFSGGVDGWHLPEQDRDMELRALPGGDCSLPT